MTCLPLDIERLALLGWRCVPATRRKKGMFEGYLDQATHDLDVLERWARAYPGCCWKVVPEGSGVWALDVDVQGQDHEADGVAELCRLTERHGALPPRPHGRSGSGGHLLVFRQTRPIRPGSARPVPGLDACGGRVAFTVQPSVNKRGQPYRWVVAPWELDPPPAPDWLLDLLKPPPPEVLERRRLPASDDRATRAVMRALDRLNGAPQGGRNASLNREAYVLGRYVASGFLGEQEAAGALEYAGRSMGLSVPECRATIRSAFLAARRHPFDNRRSQ